MSSLYQPAEDSYFFVDFLNNNLKSNTVSFLDMGCGTCIIAEAAKQKGIKNILAVDINPEAIQIAKQKGFKTLQSDLFTKIPKEITFDIICFNAPYLPHDKREPKESRIATTGGKKGDEISVKFLKQAQKFLTTNGKIWLLISSLTPLENIKKYNPKIVATKNFFTEKLLILEIQKQEWV